MKSGRRNSYPGLARGWNLVCVLVLLSLVSAQCGAPSSTPSTAAVRVAVLTPMTGELATFGETVRNGISLAFDEWNERGGLAGRRIEWVLEDTGCDPVEARQAAERAIVQQGVSFLVGGVCSEAAIPIARVADERGVLFIATTATHPLVTVDDTGATRSLVFRSGYAYPYQGGAAARFALNALNVRRAAVLVDPSDDFVRSLADEFVAAFVAGGGQVVATPAYSRRALYPQRGAILESQDADFDAILAEVAGNEPDVLYVPGAYPVANRVGSHVLAQALGVTLIGSDLWDNGALDLDALDGAYFTLHYSRQAPSPVAEAWAGRYLSVFALEPDTLAALGYDAASLLASAMESAGSLSPDAVARRLEVVEFEGVTGRWSFDAQHNPIKPVVVVLVEGGDVAFYDLVGP